MKRIAEALAVSRSNLYDRQKRDSNSCPRGNYHKAEEDTEAIEACFGLVDRVPHRIEWLSDNGPIYTAAETKAFEARVGFVVCRTPVESPESNGMAEAFIKTFKRDYVEFALFGLSCPSWKWSVPPYNKT